MNRGNQMNMLGQTGSCVVCMRGTDTALAFQGSPEWCIGGLHALGLPVDEAVATFTNGYGEHVPEWMIATYRVCAECVGNIDAEFPEPALILPGAEIPSITQKETA